MEDAGKKSVRTPYAITGTGFDLLGVMYISSDKITEIRSSRTGLTNPLSVNNAMDDRSTSASLSMSLCK